MRSRKFDIKGGDSSIWYPGAIQGSLASREFQYFIGNFEGEELGSSFVFEIAINVATKDVLYVFIGCIMRQSFSPYALIILPYDAHVFTYSPFHKTLPKSGYKCNGLR